MIITGLNGAQSVKRAALVSVCALAIAANPVQAQDIAASPELSADDEIVVTGSRIGRSELSSPTPLSVMTSEQLGARGQTNIQEMVSQVAALVGSSSSIDNSGGDNVGVNFLNLRNLGSDRTLVLVNGRRHVGADPLGSASVDTNTIPVALLERVEVTTGGASAIYGADGVSGVVNFILKRDFEGFRLNLQAGISDYGDAGNYSGSLIAGTNFAEGRGNVTLAYEYDRRNPLQASDRDFLSNKSYWFMNNPAQLPGTPDVAGVAASVPFTNIRDTFVAADGLIDPFSIFGGPWRGGDLLDPGQHVGSTGAGVPSGTIGGNGTEMWRIINWGVLPRTERHGVNLLARFDVSPAASFFVEGKYTKVIAKSVQQSTFAILNTTFNDNPFLPANVRNAAILAGAGNPAGGGAPLMYSRFDIDSGGKWVKRDSDTWRVVAGVEGDLAPDLKYNVSLNYGRTDTVSNRQLRLDDRYFAASDVVLVNGTPTCRSNINPAGFANTPVDVLTTFNPAGGAKSFTPGANSGCVPLNAFVDNAAVNKAANDWIYTTAPIKGRLTEKVVSGYLSGNSNLLNFNLPGGPIEVVVGSEYRKETAQTDFPALMETGPVFVFDRGAKDQRGAYDVWEAFTEISLPIVKDGGPLLHELTVDGAYRYSDYSTIGKTDTWSVRGLWAPISDLRFRATLSRAIRAPNVNELFGATQPSAFLPVDPCSVGNLNSGSATRVANCTTALGALGLTPTLNLPSTAVNFIGSTGGNPGLAPETARTITAGVVVQPSFVPNLRFTLDYWRIKMQRGIITPSSQDIVDACYDAASLDNAFCPLITRAPNGDINGLSVRKLNVASFKTAGWDFGAHYHTDLGNSRISADVTGTYLSKLALQGTLDGALDNERGESGQYFNGGTLLGGPAPKWVVNIDLRLDKGPFALTYGLNYRSAMLRVENDTAQPPAEIMQPFRLPEMWNHSVRLAYNVNDRYEFYAGVRNLANQKPAPNMFSLPIDPIGRYFYTGVTINFGR